MRILVPTDFSKNAQNAIDYAVAIADKSSAELVVLHAHQLIDTLSLTRKLLFEEYNYSVARKLHDELEILKKRIARVNPRIKVSAELSDNDARRAIAEASGSASLIVMGTQGASRFKKIFMGSTTASVIGNTSVPVLAIPRDYKWKTPVNILLATNCFEKDPGTLEMVFYFISLFEARLHIIVFTDIDTTGPEGLGDDKENLENYRKTLQEEHKNIMIQSAHLKGGNFEQAVQQYVDEHAIDILAMITHKKSLLENIFHRSATRNMAYRTRVPLLAIPSTEAS